MLRFETSVASGSLQAPFEILHVSIWAFILHEYFSSFSRMAIVDAVYPSNCMVSSASARALICIEDFSRNLSRVNRQKVVDGGGRVLFNVSNSGIGISPSPSIFFAHLVVQFELHVSITITRMRTFLAQDYFSIKIKR